MRASTTPSRTSRCIPSRARSVRALARRPQQGDVERAARVATGWLPGWRPWPELAEWIRILKDRAAELGRDPKEIEIAPQFSVTIAKTPEEAEKRYMASGLVAHRKSLAYTGRDLSKQVVANLVGSPDLIREKVGASEDRRRSRLRPDDPRRVDGRVRGPGGVVRQDGDVARPATDRRRRCQQSVKSATFRVATAAPWERAIAAIWASSVAIDRPSRRRSALIIA